MTDLTELAEWKALLEHQRIMCNQHMRDIFDQDPKRFDRYSLHVGPMFLDYSRNRINENTISLLCAFANRCQLAEKVDALFSGASVNVTENRAALHTALRHPNPHAISFVDSSVHVATQIVNMRVKMRILVQKLQRRQWMGITGKPIDHVINLGVGGSFLGPLLCTDALKEYTIPEGLSCTFLSSVDHADLRYLWENINPETTLFIISSKSFTTLETLTNANTLCHWLEQQYGQGAREKHFMAITAAPEKAMLFGIPEQQILPMWEWVTGRYSLWSAIGLPIMLAIGSAHFDALLQGAYLMDQHFQKAPLHQNMPILLALLGVWYSNFFGSSAHAIAPYTSYLRYFIPYLQQLEMESNGKSLTLAGTRVRYTTSPVVFGEQGIQGQHAYHQLLHQGTHLIPIDFIVVCENHMSHQSWENQHQAVLFASALSQASAFMQGNDAADDHRAKEYDKGLVMESKKVFGNKPSNLLLLDDISPKSLGALLALYEHKAFVQGALWNINSFDQAGVELGKQLLPEILQAIQSDDGPLKKNIIQKATLDGATLGCIRYWHEQQRQVKLSSK